MKVFFVCHLKETKLFSANFEGTIWVYNVVSTFRMFDETTPRTCPTPEGRVPHNSWIFQLFMDIQSQQIRTGFYSIEASSDLFSEGGDLMSMNLYICFNAIHPFLQNTLCVVSSEKKAHQTCIQNAVKSELIQSLSRTIRKFHLTCFKIWFCSEIGYIGIQELRKNAIAKKSYFFFNMNK